MFNSKPTIDSAIEHFTKGTAVLRTVQTNALDECAEKNAEVERLDEESSAAAKTAERAGRIAGRLDELLA